MIKVTVYDDFLKTEMTGEFQTEQEAREFYAEELGTFEDDIQIVKIERSESK